MSAQDPGMDDRPGNPARGTSAKTPDDFAALAGIRTPAGAPSWRSESVIGGLLLIVAVLAAATAWRAGRYPEGPPLITVVERDGVSRKTILVVRTDAACNLTIGSMRALLKPGMSLEVPVAPGTHAIECVSAEDPMARSSQVRHVDGDTRVMIELDLAESVAIRRTKA